MQICGQTVTQGIVERITRALKESRGVSRRHLARGLCEQMGWRSANGKIKETACRKALIVLHRQGLIDLPEAKPPSAARRSKAPGYAPAVAVADITCSIEALGEIEVQLVGSRYSKRFRIWKALMDGYHYLGSGPLCGAQVRYLLWSSRHGYLGGLSFNGAVWALKKRDAYIGWTEGARRANLQRVICNSRFLIVPTIRVPNLASYVLGQCAKRIAGDWKVRYGVEPVLMETFVDPRFFGAVSYRAANWVHVGRSRGRFGSRAEACAKEIFVYPLCAQWRKILCHEPKVELGQGQRPANAADWVEEELGTVRFYDPRLSRRLFSVVRDFYGQPQAAIPQACATSAKTKGAYRFFNNEKVTMELVLKAHVESAVERIRGHRLVLAVQDTTSLNYSAHPATNGLGPINTAKDSAVGLLVHDTMAFTEQGTPLGLLDVQCWARDPSDKGKSRRRKESPIEQKESMKWLRSYRATAEVQRLCPETTIVSVGDRESDIYELFWEASRTPQGPHLLVRCERSRKRKVGEQYLWEKMQREAVVGVLEVYVPPKGARPARHAKLEVRYSPVTLKPPKNKGFEPIALWAVYAKEVGHSSKVKSPLEWMLLTTVEVSQFAQATERLAWYTRRWGIEIYHRTLKSGCRIEDRRLGSADRLEACLAIDMVVAWRIYHLTKLGRETPQVPCTVFFEEAEWKALHTFIHKTPKLPPQPPSLRDAMRMTASLGGFLGRKCDGEPGTTTLWRGLQRLEDITAMYQTLLPYLRAGP
jgi:hypothetical protein